MDHPDWDADLSITPPPNNQDAVRLIYGRSHSTPDADLSITPPGSMWRAHSYTKFTCAACSTKGNNLLRDPSRFEAPPMAAQRLLHTTLANQTYSQTCDKECQTQTSMNQTQTLGGHKDAMDRRKRAQSFSPLISSSG